MSTEDEQKKKDQKIDVNVKIEDDGMNAVLDQNAKLLDMVEKGHVPVKTSDSEENLEKLKRETCDRFHSQRFITATSQSELARMVGDYCNEIEEKSKAFEGRIPEGSAPMNAQQMGRKMASGTYPNIQALIEDLRDREENGDKNASKIIDALFKKSLDHAKSTNTSIPLFTPEEIETEISKEGFKIPKNIEDGDLYRLTHARGRRELKKRLQQLQQNGQGD